MSLESKMIRALNKKDINQIEHVFEEIYYKYGKLVGFVISKYVYNISDVEELINDVFCNFSKVLYSIKFDNIKYYLVVQAKNAAINFIKKNKGVKFEYVDDYVDNQDGKDEGLLYELIKDMKKIISDLEINVILLRTVYCYSFVDLAKKYKKPITTISSIYHRAIKKLKKVYKGGILSD